MDDNFQFWSSPILDLSLDSFSKEIFQEFDKSVISNENDSNITILNNQFVTRDNDSTLLTHVITTEVASLKETGEHFISESPTSSSSVSSPEDEEEDTMSTTDITTPIVMEDEDNDQEIDDESSPSINISRQTSSRSASSKLESPSDFVVPTNISEDINYTPSVPADITTGVPQQEQQFSTQIINETSTYTTKEAMTLHPTTKETKAPSTPKKNSFFCFSFC